MTAARPLRADARRNRDSLLATAREVLEAGEFFDLRFDDFATRAGVGTGTLYRHFPTRQALAEAVYQEELLAFGVRARELRAALPPFEALGAFLRGFVSHLDAHRGLARTLATSLTAGSGSLTGELAEGSRVLGGVLIELLEAAVQDGGAREDLVVEDVAGSLVITLHGLSTAHDRPTWAAEADTLLTLLLDGLRRR